MGPASYSPIAILLVSLSGALSASMGTFIYGGERATENQFPYLVSIRVLRDGEFKHECGAAVVSDRYVITAAHCFSPEVNLEGYRLSIGAHTLDDEGVQYTVKRFVLHPNYDQPAQENDIALIQTRDFIQFSKNTSVIRVRRDFIDKHEKAVIAGWGDSEDGYTGLKFAKVTTITNAECRKIIPTAPIKDFSTICAFSGEQGIGVCSGDSGGPLVSNNKLIGIASWAKLCGKGVPDGFTRVSEYADWIEKTIQEI